MVLSEYRKRAGLKQSDVASILNIHQSAVSQWETGECSPSINLILPLAGIYKCSAEEILQAAKKQPLLR